MKIRVSRVLFPVTTLGYGQRIGVWFQGCSIRCEGCISRDLWDIGGAQEQETGDFFERITDLLDIADGITLTGGEPLDQEDATSELLSEIVPRFHGDVLLFSGYERAKVLASHLVRSGLVDVTVSGPYRESAGQTLYLRGSDNQTVDLLTPKAKARYPDNADGLLWEGPRRLDFFPGDSGVIMAGIPEPGWGAAFRSAMMAEDFVSRTSDQRKIPEEHPSS